MTSTTTRRMLTAAILATTVAVGVGCRDLAGLPAGVPDPGTFNNRSGALEMYAAAIYAFQPASGASAADNGYVEGAFVDFVLATGEFTDELRDDRFGGSRLQYTNATDFTFDARAVPQQTVTSFISDPAAFATAVYKELQGMRTLTTQAIGALGLYASDKPELRAHMYALQGYSEVFLSELFCSGVPLSTYDFQKDYTYHAGSRSAEVYQDAVAKFDTAIALAGDSTDVLNLARVGRGRALLQLGQYTQAIQAVANVPDDFVFQFDVDWHARADGITGVNLFQVSNVSVSDREGGTGLPYRTGGDPRSQVVTNGTNQYDSTLYFPAKYGTPSGVHSITVADGIEARLIEAEAAYKTGGDWLTPLNRARALAAPSLPALVDPGSDTARVRLIFDERAYDLFLTGHRQGDLRRLVRQYGHTQQTAYPTGAYPTGLPPQYGADVNAPIPAAEFVNPLFKGCLDRGA